ncbi:uncharacterized protein LOC116845226 isoform X2 [Odontomachus brunneus]|uniref:uncharacterized protein LOC116845226 isoform X2 n=1 Tax=Odontomachus brunneus TaxID=486640 RepID=UPI0013F17FC0|nr:uncharacterized protein LOC116845226 isoform X2 [Odontomachus brunneus]
MHTYGNINRIGQLTNALQQLNPGEYITLHGMKGFGKSCLTALTLKNMKLMADLFSCEVYWLKFICERSIDEEILIQLNTLYHKVKNLETQLEPFTPLEKDSLIRFLEHHFSKPEHQNALLILDDVYHKKIIKAFDFECKTLVLTTDIDILDGRVSKHKIKMDDGFTETETLGLFAQVLNIDIDQLPPEAKKIHRECKGMPLLIAMFAAHFEEFKEDMKIVDGTHDRWKYYLQSLKTKNPNNKVIKEFLEKQETIFDMCIDQLKPDLKEQYKTLAIFNEDVNITPMTLKIIWGQDESFNVEQQMLDLCHKSLAAKKWNKDTKSYIYGVHDLLLCHLRKKLQPDKLMQLHRLVIDMYRMYCKDDFSQLPDDNYIHSYIGYHLEQAKMYEEFPRLYFDFDFIQAKIIYSGLSDLLLDLKKYRTYITRNNSDCERHVSDLETFLQDQVSVITEHRRKNCLDIVQIAMNSQQDYVRQSARNLVMQRQQFLYLSHDKKPAHANMTHSEEVSAGICTSSFTDEPHRILAGYTSGKVILWDCENKQRTILNSCNNEISVKKIVVSAGGDYFLTLTDNGVVKLFRLFYEQDHPYNVHIDSAKEKQKSWTDFFTNDKEDDSLLKLSIKNEIILDVEFGYQDKFIAGCTNKGTVQIWNRKGEVVSSIENKKNDSITKITFTDQGALLHVMNESNGSFTVYRSGNDRGMYEYASSYNTQLQERQVIYFHNVPEHDNSLMIVTSKRALYVRWIYHSNDRLVYNFIKQERACVENDTITYVCAAITYDGEYLVVADSAGFVNVWYADTGYQPIATYRNCVTSLDTYWLQDEYCHLICGTENSLLHKWKLPIQVSSSTLVRKSLFDAIVRSYDKEDVIVKESLTNHIVILHGETQITRCEYKPTEGKISNLKLFSNGDKMLYVMERNVPQKDVPYSNKLLLFDIKTEKTSILMESSLHPIEPVILNINNNDIIVWRETNNGLRVWINTKESYTVNNTGQVAFIHKLNDKYIVTITKNGVILIWQIEQNWLPISRRELNSLDTTNISFSCLSHKKTYLAILNKSHNLMFFTFYENETIVPTRIETKLYSTHNFSHKVTYYDISQDEQYIAVGLETGLITIINIPTSIEIHQLSFHNNPIKQLSWGPTALKAPILLSLANDELAWWNVNLHSTDKFNVKQRRSRKGITHSKSTPSFNTNKTLPIQQIPNSQSLDTDGVWISKLQHNKESSASTSNGVDMHINWKSKISKDPKKAALLAAVELPQCRTAKICISPDFMKFVTVDIYGAVSTFKPFSHA